MGIKKSVAVPSFRRRRQLEQDLEHVTQEMYRRNLELAETNKALSLLRRIDELVLESRDNLEVICSQIATAISATNGYPLVAIFAYRPNQKDILKIFGLSTNTLIGDKQAKLCKKISVDVKSPWLTRYVDSAVDVKSLPLSELAQMTGYSEEEVKTMRNHAQIESVFVSPLNTRKMLAGLMVIGFPEEASQIPLKERELLKRLSQAVGVAVDNKLLFEENQKVLQELQRTNEKLKALDESKDEFISMASHQLRTPLTSVKGYVSMVMDGDAGPVNDNQRKLLDQAFVSSQRMVYLIADLLNVSRLRTGKFLVETHPTDLAAVIESEISQLTETAKLRGLQLSFDKPPKFPRLMLDETKIRQVVMNFVDNAIYYTPSGGHITLSLKELPETVEFTVDDDGIGVPKHEQHNLFNKFYRAENAKKARPDGTGLGLFMAKKVVIAHGGSIVFKSQENQGSTFGFTLNKSKLKV